MACDWGLNMPKGLFFAVSDELNAAFHDELKKRLGRPLRRGDVTNAGEDAIKVWMGDKYQAARDGRI